MFSALWLRRVFGAARKNVRRNQRLKSLRVLPSLERLEARELLSTATPYYVMEPTQQEANALASRGPTASPLSGSTPPSSAFSPSQIESAYGFNQPMSFASYTGGTLPLPGAGQTIAIVDAYNDPNIYSDLVTFDEQYGLSAPPTFEVVNQSGQIISTNGTSSGLTPPSNNAGWGVEESLDVEWAHAIAPGANIVLVETNSNNFSDLLTGVQTAAGLAGVSVVSMSWGGGEFLGENYYDSYFTTPANHPGVSFIASSGDNGAPPSYPAASPNVLAVGGTTLTTSDSSGDYGSETGWSGSGGGLSADETQPSYQKGIVTQSSTKRANPDVAYDADPNTGFAVYDSIPDTENGTTYVDWFTVGGTSDAAPQWAALTAIADQGRAVNGESSLDGPSQLLPMIYQMPSSNFHDITSGNNGYSAGPGYDLVTGRGTPLANDVIAYLVTPPSSPPPPPPSAPGAPTGLAANAVSSSQINLSWNTDSGATDGYVIDRSPNGSGSWTQIGATSSGTTTYSDTGLSAATKYYYEVFAVNSVGDSPPSNIAHATTLSPPPPTPTAPTNLTAKAVSSSQINLSWTDPTSDKGDKYLVERSSNGSTGWTQIGTTTGSTYSNTGLRAGTTYYYEVLADNNGVNSSPSNVASATTSSRNRGFLNVGFEATPSAQQGQSASSGSAPSNQLTTNNMDLAGLSAAFSSPTNLSLVDQLFVQTELNTMGSLNSFLSALYLSPLVTGLRPQAANDPFGGPLDWA